MFIFNAPAFQLVMQADIMTKMVLFALFMASVTCIWIILSKFFLLWRQKKSMRLLQQQIKKVRSFDDLLALGKRLQGCAGGRLLVRSFSELKELLNSQGPAESGKSKLSPNNVEHLKLAVEQNLDQVLSEEEQYMPVLGTSAAVSPLVGLFGTVWGLVHAFVDISRSKSADISVVAPGIAEALTTTLAGLIVAIPALIFFHYFSNELRKLEQQLWGVNDKFLSIVRQTFVERANER